MVNAIPRNGEIFVVRFESQSPDKAEADEKAQKNLLPASVRLCQLSPTVLGIVFSTETPWMARNGGKAL